jgi:ABC-2 type transport system permease protein
VLTGHDEPSMEATFTRALQKLNTQTEELNFLTESKVPNDASAVIVFGPQSDFSEDDVKKLESYVDDGGRVFIALDVMKNSSLTNVKKFLNDEGIKASDGAIAETDENYYYQSPYLLLPEVKDTNATKDVTGTLQVFMPYSLGLTKVKTDGVKFVNLAVTSDKAIAKNSQSADDLQTAVQETDEKIRKESGDEQGRFSLGLIAKKGKGRVAAFGSVYTFTETMNQVVSGRNETLFSDVFSYLLPDQSKSSVNIPAKMIDSTTLTISARVIKVYGFFFGIFVPLFLIVCGAIVVVYRKRR